MSLATVAGEALRQEEELRRQREAQEAERRRKAAEAALRAVLVLPDGSLVPLENTGLQPVTSGVPADSYAWGDGVHVLLVQPDGNRWQVAVARRLDPRAPWSPAARVASLADIARALGANGG
jgi:hypothetical protein